MTVKQYSRLLNCRNCEYEVQYYRDIENAATPKVTANWLCPNCGLRVPAIQVEVYVAGEMATPAPQSGTSVAIPETLSTNFTLATPDLGGYESVIKP